MSLNKVFLILGRSNSGKDTIFKMILDDPELLFINNIKQYTTRPRRINEEDSYSFIDDSTFKEISADLAEYREYNAYIDDANKNVWYYGTPSLQYTTGISISNSHTIASAISLISKYEDLIVPIYLYCDDDVLLKRALIENLRGDNITEARRRYTSDKYDYRYIDAMIRNEAIIYTTSEQMKEIRAISNLHSRAIIIDTSKKSKEEIFSQLKEELMKYSPTNDKNEE